MPQAPNLKRDRDPRPAPYRLSHPPFWMKGVGASGNYGEVRMSDITIIHEKSPVLPDSFQKTWCIPPSHILHTLHILQLLYIVSRKASITLSAIGPVLTLPAIP
ncbi:GQ67_04970T0 [Komagataella phaffii]|nr:GQ67_04970T0 [Komagataella phaffii]AOA70076.1 GQ68_04951T0 [Komagataella phaffii GS115]